MTLPHYWPIFVYNVQWYSNKDSVNSLAPGRYSCDLKLIIFKLISRVDILSFSFEFAPMWIPQDLTGDSSTLVTVRQQVITWASVDSDLCDHMGALPGVVIPMLKIRRPNGRLIFNIGIAILR